MNRPNLQIQDWHYLGWHSTLMTVQLQYRYIVVTTGSIEYTGLPAWYRYCGTTV